MVSSKESPGTSRPFIGVTFECCSVYTRLYREPTSDHYAGRCPRCLLPVRIDVRAGGTPARQLRVRRA